jgi:hypothetical protein
VRPVRQTLSLLFLIALLFCIPSIPHDAVAAEARTEAGARDALKQAERDYRGKNYSVAAARLQRALKACGTGRCMPTTRGALLCDIGTMQFRRGDKDAARRSWIDAVTVFPDVNLNAPYETSDLRAAFEAARSASAAEVAAASKPAAGTATATAAGSSGPAGSGPETRAPSSVEGPPMAPETLPHEQTTQVEASSHEYARFWVGLAGALDFVHLPAGQDLCRLDQSGTKLINTLHYYCTNTDSSDFPSRTDIGLQNNALDRMNTSRNGNVADSIALGNVRVFLAADYALTSNLLVGLRLGLVFREYPGSGTPPLDPTVSTKAAVHDGATSSFGLLHLEGRATYLFGRDPLAFAGLAPMVFAGGGISEFDASASDTVVLKTGAPVPVNIWQTDGPGFLMAGAGVRWATSPHFALTAAARLNVAIGGSGVIPTAGPELGGQYGF